MQTLKYISKSRVPDGARMLLTGGLNFDDLRQWLLQQLLELRFFVPDSKQGANDGRSF